MIKEFFYRIFILLLSLILITLSFSACGKSEENNTQNKKDNESSQFFNEDKNISSETENFEIIACDNVQIGGIAVIQFTMNSKDYYGIINTSGEIIYHTENPIDVTSIGTNYGYIDEYETPKTGLINYNNGEVQWFENDTFDEIIGYGDDLLLTYKDNSTISASEHIYCVIDSKTGKTTKKNISSSKLSHPGKISGITRHNYIHMGNGWFISKADNSGVREDTWLYDSNNNISYVLDGSIGVISNSFVNGKIYMTTSSYSADILRRESNGQGKYIDFPSSIEWHFVFDQKGVVESVNAFTVGSTGIIATYEDVNYLQLIDTATQKTYEYTNFPVDMIEHVTAYDDYCLVFIEGADNKDYFTLVDKTGQQLFEPIRYTNSSLTYSEVKLSEDRLIYQCKSKSSNTFDMCKIFDLNGIEIFTIDYIDSDDIVEFQNGILMNEDKYIDKFGKEIKIVLK